mgnify:CR=1 FL=1
MIGDVPSPWPSIPLIPLPSFELSGPNSRGTIANTATNSTITNVYVKDLILTTGADTF